MANMCEVTVTLRPTLNGMVKSLVSACGIDALPPGDDAVISIDGMCSEDDGITIHGETRWWLHPEEAVRLVDYLISNTGIGYDDITISIGYLEMGCHVCGRYYYDKGILQQGDADPAVWEKIKGFWDDNISDKDWQYYWDSVYEAQDNAELKPIYNFKTKEHM